MNAKVIVMFATLVLLLSGTSNSAELKGSLKPTKDNLIILADKYIDEVGPMLTLEEKTTADNIMFMLNSKKSVPVLFSGAIEEMVNHTTLALTNTKGIETIILTSANLVKMAPDNARVSNLFGVILHSIGKNDDALTALEYTLKLKPDNSLANLNAANTYLDMNKDAKAKALIDKVISLDPNNKSAYSALAIYWYKKNDFEKTLQALMKAASLGGGVIRKKADENKPEIEKNEVAADDDIATMEQKTSNLKGMVPKTTADVIEDQFPAEAKEIRDRYSKLIEAEKMIMPPLPMVNTSGVRGWFSSGTRFMDQWQKAFFEHAKKAQSEVAGLQYGIKAGDSKAVKKEKGKAAAQKQLQRTLGDANQMMRMLEGMGMPKSQIEMAKKKLAAAMGKQGIKAPAADEAASEDGEIKSDEDAQKQESVGLPPGWDSGSMFAITNYRDYMFIRMDYEKYFIKFYKDFDGKAKDIVKVYQKKVDEEDIRHKTAKKNIDDSEDAESRANGGNVPNPEKYDDMRKSEDLSHKKRVNAIGDDYFAQWSNLALLQYKLKMKPKLDEFWYVCGLYIRNMNDPEVMKNEYAKVKQMFVMYGSMAVNYMNCGTTFKYLGETYEDELRLEKDILQAKELAEVERTAYLMQTKTAESALEKWIDDTFALGVSGEFLSMKITPRKLIIEEYICGMNFKHVYDFKTGEWTMTRSFCAKIDIGIQVGPMKAGVSARADFLESYDKINTRNGQVVEAGSSFARASAGAASSAGNLSVGGGVVVTLDPAAESELSAKFYKSAGYKDTVYDKVKGGMSF